MRSELASECRTGYGALQVSNLGGVPTRRVNSRGPGLEEALAMAMVNSSPTSAKGETPNFAAVVFARL